MTAAVPVVADGDMASAAAFETVGARLFPGAAIGQLAVLEAAFADWAPDRAGLRIADAGELRPLVERNGPLWRIAAALIGLRARPVRALLFDKSATANWALGWHQDRTICVRERRSAPGFGAWTVKDGLLHVSPPQAMLDAMVTLRVHLDPVTMANAPLLIAPGSHRIGRVAVAEIGATVRRHGRYACLARPGDVWAYATPILHASDAATQPARRRVLQLDYAAGDLPNGLEWRGL